MGKFARMKKHVTFDTDDHVTARRNTLERDVEPITRQESFETNRFIALAMIHCFGLRDWMKPYLSEDEWEQHLHTWLPDVVRMVM